MTKEQKEEKIKHLRSYLEHKRKMKLFEAEIEEIKEIQQSAKSLKQDGMPHGSGGFTDLSDYIVRLDEKKEKLQEERWLTVKIYNKIVEEIGKINNDSEAAVLTYRYIKGYTWERTAEEMNYSISGIRKKHYKALEKFEIL